MYYEQVSQSAYDELCANSLLADHNHTYNPYTEQLVIWTNVRDAELGSAICLAASRHDRKHANAEVDGLYVDDNQSGVVATLADLADVAEQRFFASQAGMTVGLDDVAEQCLVFLRAMRHPAAMPGTSWQDAATGATVRVVSAKVTDPDRPMVADEVVVESDLDDTQLDQAMLNANLGHVKVRRRNEVEQQFADAKGSIAAAIEATERLAVAIDDYNDAVVDAFDSILNDDDML